MAYLSMHLKFEGWLILKKKFPASACRKKKNACSTNVTESFWEKIRGQKISCPPHC